MINHSWSLRSRLAVGLIAVAVTAILGVTIAALVGTQRGFITTEIAERQRIAEQVAVAAGVAYTDAQGWDGADLGPATAIAEAANARLIVRPGSAGGAMSGRSAGSVTAAVVVGEQQVGFVRLTFGPGDGSSGRSIAWTWIAAAAAFAIFLAIVVAWWLSSRLISPLSELASTVRAFGAGDRTIRATSGGAPEISELSHAFDDMADRIQRGEETRRALAHDVAHELRTPLAALQAGLEELRDGLETPDAARLAALHDQSLRMGKIVDDLGRLAEAEAPDINVRPRRVDVNALAQSALTEAQALLNASGLHVHLRTQESVSVLADPDRLRQILSNLLTNCARYCHIGDRVSIDITQDQEWGIIAVADNGPGMNEADAAHAFDRFYRGSLADDAHGSGLGLAVVRALAQAQGGDATLTSALGVGTTVVVHLPRWTDQGMPDS